MADEILLRLLDLDKVQDDDIDLTSILAIELPTQTFHMTLEQLINFLPLAGLAQKGMIFLASDTEAINGSDESKALTSKSSMAQLKSRISSDLTKAREDYAASEKSMSKAFLKTGGTITGNLTVQVPTSIIHDSTNDKAYYLSKINGVNNWYVGKVGTDDDFLRFYSYILKCGLIVDAEGLLASVGGKEHRVYHDGNLTAETLDVYTKEDANETFFPLSGGTIEGANGGLILKTTNGINYILGVDQDGGNQWYVGKPSASNDELRFYSYELNKGFVLKSDGVYVIDNGIHKLFHEGNPPHNDDIKDSVYTGTSATNLDFPKGTTLSGFVGASPVNTNLNDHTRLYTLASTANLAVYGTDMYGSHVGTYLKGTWAFRGVTGSREGNWIGNFQRIDDAVAKIQKR